MFLKTITICGFKSFGAKNVLDFWDVQSQSGSGVTAVVGPNGSGKSNIADAIRWVLGEQSAKTLRVKKNEEIIFLGNAKKGKSSYVEVSLILDNSNNVTPIEFSEVEITRRLYRNGENEYFLNKKRVRLLDILELLARCGFGHSTYTVIGQGMVDSLLFYGPAERKVFFEEASGVKQYEIKREQAAKKLEGTERNIIRIKDLLYELNPRLVVAKKQYQKYENKQTVESRLQEVSFDFYTNELGYIYTEKIKKEKNIVEIKAKIEELLKKIQNENQRFQQSFNIGEEQKKKQSGLRSELEELFSKKEELLRKIFENETMLSNTDVQFEINSCQKDIESLKNELEILGKKRNEVIESNKKLTQNLTETKKELTEIDNKVNFLSVEIEKIEKEAAGLAGKELLVELNNLLAEYQSFRQAFELIKDLKDFIELKKKEDLVAKKINLLIDIITNSENFDQTKLTDLKIKASNLTSSRERLLREVQEIRVKDLAQKEIADNIERRIADNQQKLKLAESELEKIARKGQSAKNETIATEKIQLKKAEEQLLVNINTIKTEIKTIEETDQGLDQAYTKFYQDERERQRELAELREEISPTEIEIAKFEAKSDDLKRDILENFNEEYLKKILANLVTDGSENQELFNKMINLRKQSYSIGEIDPFIRDEYQDLLKRVDDLSEQLGDLEKAKEDLASVTEELDRRIKTQFTQTFRQISREFTKYFKILFGGGEASLTLENNEEGFGVEISAAPPGKKSHSLSALSGGERTLTSIALLFAILSINPSPFCVLDEVDAALDEMNTRQFLKILKTLSSKSQFLLITHNRETMKEADIIYGVTNDENHLSRVYSLKLSEITT